MESQRKSELRDRIDNRDTRKVLELLEAESRNLATDPDVWFLMGVAQFRLGRFDIAESHFRRAAELNPRNPEVVYYIGFSAQQQSHLTDAIGAYHAAVALDPSWALPRKKLDELTPGWSVAMSAAPSPPPAPSHPSARPNGLSRIGLPAEEEMASYKKRYEQIAAIEAQADFDAALHAPPRWYRRLFIGLIVLMVVVMILFVVFLVFLLGVGAEWIQGWCQDLQDTFGEGAGGFLCRQ